MFKKVLSILFPALAAAVLSLSLWAWLKLQPNAQDLTVPSALISIESEQGQSLLARSAFQADYPDLEEHFQAQIYISYCGVASSVAALQSLGVQTSQEDFFTEEAEKVRTRWKVTFGGMSLPVLAGLLQSHGVSATTHHGADLDLSQFRSLLKENLGREGDIALVNYHRKALDQEGGGHISPVSAYDEKSDRFLIMDTAEHKYPPVWVEAAVLFEGIQGKDSDSGLSRGLVLVSPKG